MVRNRTVLCLLLLVLSLVAQVSAQSTKKESRMGNAGFEDGLSKWSREGNVTIVTQSPLEGKASVQIGPKAGTVRQRYDVPGLRILYVAAKVKTSDENVIGRLKVQCFDAHNHLLLNLEQKADSKKATQEGDTPGLYFKTHAFTAFIIVSIEKDGNTGTLTADTVQLDDDDRDKKIHLPTVDVAQMMQPIWQGDTVYNETVLMYSESGASGRGKLLFNPLRILSVRDSALTTEYKEGIDYTVAGREIVRTPNSRMPMISDSDFPKTPYPWVSLVGKHIVVTYTHSDPWQGPTPQFAGDRLPETMARLADKKRSLTVVALGDSITLGINVSGFRGNSPYLPPYPDLFVSQLARLYHQDRITLYNVALGGMTAQWGRDNAESLVASLNPDLVIIAFGMNDFWSVSPAEFRESIHATMEVIRKRRPKTEFILVAPMKFDPAYTTEAVYVNNLSGYAKELNSLVGPGVCLFNMTALSDALYAAKSQRDLATDPMHPDDFLSRWYAQGLVALLQHPTP